MQNHLFIKKQSKIKNSKLVLILTLVLIILSCKGFNKQEKETIHEKESTEQQSAQILEEIKYFAGTWSSPDFYPIIDIKIEADGKFMVREVFGLNSNKGVVYQAEYKNGEIVAIGKEKDFYKWTLPTFKFIDDNMDTIEFNSGVGPIELQKTTKEMPGIRYSAPENND